MRKVKWGVLGTAYIFKRDTAEGMRLAENCELTAIAGRNPEKVRSYQEQYGFQKAYDSYDALLEDPEIEAVYIPLPNTMHVEWAIKAMRHGKHVLCEKPLAPTAEEAEAMFRAARENGVYLMEAFAYQHSPFVKAVRQEVEEGSIGDIRYIETALITSDYDHSNIRMRRETLGGSTYDLGVYAISLIQTMMGEEPKTVKAIGSMNAEGIDLYTTGIFEYENGAKASFDCGMVLATEKHRCLDRFQIHGTKGMIVAEDFGFNSRGTLSYWLQRDGETQPTLKKVEVPHNYCLEAEQLGRCITEGEKPYVTADFSTALARTVDRVLKEIGY